MSDPSPSNHRRAMVIASAPGRICLFGEHQDYLGLPVIAAAIDLRVELRARPVPHSGFLVNLPDIGEIFEYDPNVENAYRHGRDYLYAASNVLRRQGLSWPNGYEISVHGCIPINSGASSSSALQVAWCALLLELAGDNRVRDPESVASIAHESEVKEFNSPGGMMDHFSCAVGGVIWLDCRPPYRVQRLPRLSAEFVLVDSGIPKDTNGVLGDMRRRVESLHLPFASMPVERALIDPAIAAAIAPSDYCLYEATVSNRELTQTARSMMQQGMDYTSLGSLLNAHHTQLSRNLGISLARIDELLRIGMERGALGGKINGSGGGGSFFLLCPGCAEEVKAAYVALGYRAWIVRIGGGVEVHSAGA